MRARAEWNEHIQLTHGVARAPSFTSFYSTCLRTLKDVCQFKYSSFQDR